ncbi:MAG: glycosyltransferase, partial [Candidatus Acidiferrum sp.]
MALGHKVEVVTALPNYPTGKIFSEYRQRWYVSEKWEEIPVHRVWVYASSGAGIKRMANYASFLATSFLGIYKACKPDWIFVESPPPTLALSGLFASRLWQVPVIVNVADLWPDSIRALGLMQNKLLLG